MSIEFNKYCSLILIFSQDLKKVLLEETNGKHDGFFYMNDKVDVEEVHISRDLTAKLCNNVEATQLRIITTLPNVNKAWKIDVFMTTMDETIIKEKEHIKWFDVNCLDESCHPNLKWLIPMSIDLSIYGSSFNQILMK